MVCGAPPVRRRPPAAPDHDADREPPAAPARPLLPLEPGEWDIPRVPLRHDRAVIASTVLGARLRTIVLRDTSQIPPAPRPAQRLSGQPYTLPEDAVEWIEALRALRLEAATNPRVSAFREHIARACDKTAAALRGEA